MAPPTGALSSLLLLVAATGCGGSRCSEGRTYPNAIISPNSESTRILRSPGAAGGLDCTAACCELASCELAWTLEGRCYLVSCRHPENCLPQPGPSRSSLTFVRRWTPRSAQLLESEPETAPNPGSASGLWGHSPEDVREDSPFLGIGRGPESRWDGVEDYQELGPGHPPSRPGDPDWGFLPNSSTLDGPAGASEPALQYQDLERPSSSPLPPAVAPSSGEVPGEETSQLQEQPSSGEEVLMPSPSPSSVIPESSSAAMKSSPILLVIPASTEPSGPALPSSTDPAELVLSEQPVSPHSTENNQPPMAVAGPNQELFLPVASTTLDGSRSSDDHGIAGYRWECIRGPKTVEMENADKAVATVSGLQVGTYGFRLTVTDMQGLSGSTTLMVAVKTENNSPPRAQAGGRHILVLPQNSITLDGSRSTDDQGIVSYLWIRDGQSPAAGDVLDGSDHRAALQLANLVEGVYTFHLRVADSQGASDTDTATVEVQPDPRQSGLVELVLQVGAGQLSERQKDTLVRQLAALLDVADSAVKVQRVQAHSDLSTVIVFYVQRGPPFSVLKAAEVARSLHRSLSKEPADFLLFKVLRIDTAGCLLTCSGHGYCDPITKRCVCSWLWMENLIQRYIRDGESNCEWSVFYVVAWILALLLLTGGSAWLCICCCTRRKRTKIRKKTKYTILDNMDDQETVELTPKYGIKHRSTEHNSSLMVSESELDSEQDDIFSRASVERGHAGACMNGAVGNGAFFSYGSKDR